MNQARHCVIKKENENEKTTDLYLTVGLPAWFILAVCGAVPNFCIWKVDLRIGKLILTTVLEILKICSSGVKYDKLTPYITYWAENNFWITYLFEQSLLKRQQSGKQKQHLSSRARAVDVFEKRVQKSLSNNHKIQQKKSKTV